jgi:hypothetical protein
MRYGRFALALAVLLGVVACAGGGDEADTGDDQAEVELDFSLDTNFGSVALESGFRPDPYTVGVVSGGAVDVAGLDLGSDCNGYATTAPDFEVELEDGSSMIRIFFVADESGEDATLIVSDPDGDWVCNDDYGGADPLVEFAPAEEGIYDIWVGSYSEEDLVAGTLYVTELEYEPSDVQ